jgi:SAM-dependent methyltransferase
MARSSRYVDSPPICDYEGSNYRTDFWEGRGRDYEDQAERLALRAMLPPGGRRLLDLGAGFGRLGALYDRYDEVVLLDYSQSQLEFARQRFGDERFVYVAADLYHLPLADDVADATVMVRVLHHLADVPAALGQVVRVTRADGTFVLEYANKRHIKNIARFLGGQDASPFGLEPEEFAPLHFDFHPDWIAQRLAEAGLTVEGCRSVSLFRSALLKKLVPTSLLVALDGLLQRPTARLAPGPSQFVQTCLRKQNAAPWVSRAQIFRCPDCSAWPLHAVDAGLTCPSCGMQWPIIHGIHVFK